MVFKLPKNKNINLPQKADCNNKQITMQHVTLDNIDVKHYFFYEKLYCIIFYYILLYLYTFIDTYKHI